MKLQRVALVLAILAVTPALAEETDADRAQRWKDLQHAILDDRPIKDGANVISLEAPDRALDAALVPIKVTLKGPAIRKLYLVADDNPSPLVGTFTFGPAADTHELRLRIRVDAYTYVHAIAETTDGQLYGTERFVKAAGGCSAPATSDPKLAMEHLGQMKLKPAMDGPAGIEQVQLLVSHPNFNGMQMDQVTRNYTPARFINKIEVKSGDRLVFDLESDISMSSDPAITFGLSAEAGPKLDVDVKDSARAEFQKSFELPAKGA